MSFPTTTKALSQIGELNNLAREFNFYARGTKQIADAKAFKSQFTALRNGINTAKTTANTSVQVAKNAEGIAGKAKKITDLIQKGAFKQVNPRWGAALTILLNVALAGTTLLSIKTQEEIQGINLKTGETVEAGLADTFTRTINNSIQIKTLQKKDKEFDIKINDIKEEILKQEVNNNFFKKQINDITYEVRQGRKILETRIAEAKKQANDALYEVRQGRAKLEERISSEFGVIKSRIDNLKTTFDTTINGFKTSTNTVIESLKSQFQTTKNRQETIDREIANINQKLRVGNQDENSIASKAANIVFNQVNPKLNQINQDNYGQNLRINNIVDGLSALGGQLRSIDGRVLILEKTPIKLPPQKNYDADIANINNRLKEQERVNGLALPKLDQLLTLIPLIPARVADNIKPSIPTVPQIEQAAATGFCRTTQPGGCGRKMMDDVTNNINSNTNNKSNNILDAINTGLNASQLAWFQKIDNKLGAQLPGGLAGKLTRFTQWLQLDRALNVLIFAATVHNAFMLSNDIGQTLIGALNNILQLIGLKDDDGKSFDIGSIISNTVENFIKSIVGDDNYQSITTAWAKANRIYQATVNVLNNFQGLASTILSGLEMTLGKIAKIGNALRKSGEVLESAYGWMNPQPKLNRVTQTLESLQNGASTIQMVTQAPLDIINATTELTNSTIELTKAIKEDGKPENKGNEAPEPEQLKATESSSKLVSVGLELADLDFDVDE